MHPERKTMLKIWSSVVTNEKIQKYTTVFSDKKEMDEALLDCLQQLCRFFDIEMPLWHTKHTKQLVAFRKCVFKKDDFIDRFAYDKFIIEILDQ